MSSDVHAEGVALVDAMAERGITLRLLGGAAVFEHCPQAMADGPYRVLGDLDAMTTGTQARALAGALQERGYVADARFNALHGDRRMIFSGPAGKLDVFVDTFEMCHVIDLRERLSLDRRTLTVSDLVLTKLQIVELNAKDAQDVRALLAEHQLGEGHGDHVDVAYLSSLVAGDWPLWRTLTGTLRELATLEPVVAGPAGELIAAFEDVPKSRGWRIRARLGEHRRWYELPDEVG